MPQFEPGLYWMAEPQMGTSKSAKGMPFLFLQGEITHISQNGESVSVPVQAERTVRLYLSDAAFPYTMDRLRPLGFNGDFANPQLTGEHVKGIWADCSVEMYEGKSHEKWQLPGGGSVGHEPLDSDTVRRLTAMRENHERNNKQSIPF